MTRRKKPNPNKCQTPYCKNKRARFRKICNKCKTRRYRAKDKLRALFYTLKWSAQKRNKEFTITLTYFRAWAAENNFKPGTGITIDRKIETLGYIPGNLQPLTQSENIRKYYVYYFNQGRGKTVNYE